MLHPKLKDFGQRPPPRRRRTHAARAARPARLIPSPISPDDSAPVGSQHITQFFYSLRAAREESVARRVRRGVRAAR